MFDRVPVRKAPSVLMRQGKKWPDPQHSSVDATYKYSVEDHPAIGIDLFSVARMNQRKAEQAMKEQHQQHQQHQQQHQQQLKKSPEKKPQHKVRHQKRKKAQERQHQHYQSDQSDQTRVINAICIQNNHPFNQFSIYMFKCPC